MVAKKLRVDIVSSTVKRGADTASIIGNNTTDDQRPTTDDRRPTTDESKRTATFDRGVVNNTRALSASAHNTPTIGSAAASDALKQWRRQSASN